jgi:fructose-bisphosphate aldolase class 1
LAAIYYLNDFRRIQSAPKSWSKQHALVANDKGLLAADEEIPTIAKRFKAIGVESNEQTHRAYHAVLLSYPALLNPSAA